MRVILFGFAARGDMIVATRDSLLVHVLSGTADTRVRSDGLHRLLGRLGFDERIRGDAETPGPG